MKQNFQNKSTKNLQNTVIKNIDGLNRLAFLRITKECKTKLETKTKVKHRTNLNLKI